MENKDQFMTTIKDKLIIFRKTMNLTQKDMSDALQMYQSHYSKVEKGEYALTLHKIYLLCKTYHINIYWLFSWETNMLKGTSKKMTNQEELVYLRKLMKENNIKY